MWPTVTDVVHGRRPAKVLELGFRVWSLVLLNGGVAVAGNSMSILVWAAVPDLTLGQAPITLQATDWVRCLLPLSTGGLLAAVRDSAQVYWLNLWVNASVLQPGAAPSPRVRAGSSDNTRFLLELSDGSIAVPLGDSSDPGRVLIWSSIDAVLHGEAPSGCLGVPGITSALARLPRGGIAVGSFHGGGGSGQVQLWPDARSIQQGEPAPVRLQVATQVSALAVLSGGALVAGLNAVKLDLWPGPPSTLVLSARVPTPTGPVFAMAKLPGGGFGLGLWPADSSSYNVQVWRPCLNGSGFDLAAQLNASGLPSALLQLPCGHLLVSMRSAHGSLSTLEIWAPAAGGFAPEPTAALKLLGQVKALVPLASHGFAAAVTGSMGTLQVWKHVGEAIDGQPPQQTVITSFPPTCALWVDEGLLVGSTQSLELWIFPAERTVTVLNTSGSVVALESLPGGGLAMGTDALEVHVWLSTQSALQGNSSDMVLNTPSLIHSIAVLTDGTLVAGGAAFVPVKCPSGQFSPGKRLYNCTKCTDGWLSVPGASSCSFPNFTYVVGRSSTIMGCVGVGVLVSQLLRRLCRHEAAKPWLGKAKQGCAAMALLLSLPACACRKSSTVAEWAALGTSLSCSLLLLPSFTGQSEGRYLALGLLVLATALLVQMLQTPVGQPSITPVGILQTSGGSQGWLEKMLLTSALAFAGLAYAVPIQSQVLYGGPSFTHGHPSWATLVGSGSGCGLRRLLAAMRSFFGTFVGETTLVLVLNLVTGVQMGVQSLLRANGNDASSALILCAVFLAALQVVSSSLAVAVALGAMPKLLTKVFMPLVDKHLRLSIALKYVNLGLKLLVLILPFNQVNKNVRLWWQCQTPALCPPDCTNQNAGTCGTAIDSTNQPVCVCAAFETAQFLVVLNCGLTALVSMGVTMMQSYNLAQCEPLVKKISRPRVKLLSQLVVAVVPAAIQTVYLHLIYQAPQCLALADVAILVYPCIAVGLLANEAKRALQGWGDQKDNLSTVFSDDLLVTTRPLAAVLAALASVVAAARARSLGPSWPSFTTDCGTTVAHWVLISMLFAAGAVASALLGRVAAPHEVSDSEQGLEVATWGPQEPPPG